MRPDRIPISKAEAIHAIKTILGWDGNRTVDGENESFRLESPGATHRSY